MVARRMGAAYTVDMETCNEIADLREVVERTAPKRWRYRISLRSVGLAVMFFCVFCGLTRAAVQQYSLLPLVPATLSLAAALGILTRSPVAVPFFVVALAGLTTSASNGAFYCGFQPATIQILVTDQNGRPVQAAGIRATLDGEVSTRFPIAEYLDEPLLTDDAGKLLIHQTEGGCWWGGAVTYYFGCMPIAHERPRRYQLHIEHDEYRAQTIEFGDLYSHPTSDDSSTYEYRIRLRPKS